MSSRSGSRRRYLGTALITFAAALLLVGIPGLLWSVFLASLFIVHRSLGPHAFTAIAVFVLSALSVAAILAGVVLGVVGRRARRSAAG